MSTNHEHRVCTYAEAEKAIREADSLFVNNCFCRTPAKAGEAKWEYCGHDVETCMGLREPRFEEDGPKYEYREIPREEALSKFEAWKEQHGFFRFMVNEEWICFCCGCGCGFFRDEEGKKTRDSCTKSSFVERTDGDACAFCGECVEVCAYGARSIQNDTMVVVAGDCYGCSACEPVCPEAAISMVARTQ
ncbi:ATP-binding protein [Planctomycetota bacterium]